MPTDESRLQHLIAENERLTLALAEAGHRILALEKLAREDGLTGLLNRRSFDLELQRAIDVQARYGEAMTLLLIDLDEFKDVNDRCGHAAGDAVLRHVAATLTARVRKSDTVARIGGDEFAVILWRVAPETAQAKADELRGYLESVAADIDGHRLAIRVSIGCAALLPDGWDSTGWYRAADARLYADKARRKDR